MKLNVFKTADEVIENLAEHFIKRTNAAIANSGECNVVLSGGSSPKRLYELLATEPYKSAVDWNNVFFFFGDERYVPFNDPASNGLMVKNALFDHLQIDESRILYMSTRLEAAEAAKEYSKRIVAHFRDKPIRFDLILLGLGDDGHTASLFPHTPVLNEQKALVAAVFLEKHQSFRITMTAAVINEAHSISFLVFGKSKAHAVAQVLEGKKNVKAYPAQLIDPEDGGVDWFLDEDAAQLLEKVK